MDSILTNAAALSALQALNLTQQDMNITQNQVSTGLAVETAADNAAYWSIGQQLTSASGIETAANTALQQSQAIMDTANSAISSVITTIDAIQSAITGASNPGASFNDINDELASLSTELSDVINGASFNGVNLLNGTQQSMSFVAGYNASATGGAVSTIDFTAFALIGGQNAANNVSTSATTVVSDTNLISQLENTANIPATNTFGQTVTVGSGATPNIVTITTTDTAGDSIVSTYTGYTQYNTTTGVGTAASTNAAASQSTPTGANVWTVSTTTTAPANSTPEGLLIQTGQEANQGTYNLTLLGGGTGNTAVTADNASDMLSAVNQALDAVRAYASSIGSTQDAMTASNTFNSAVSNDYASGLAALVDADMNTASTRLQALQTQEQLGIQSLSIANQNSQLILKLFNG
jgi:flagellin